jgi:hypothetical protein
MDSWYKDRVMELGAELQATQRQHSELQTRWAAAYRLAGRRDDGEMLDALDGMGEENG